MGRIENDFYMSIILIFLASLGSGLLGSMGMGGGGILVIFLSLFTDIPQTEAQGINLIFFIPIAIISIIVYQKRKLIKWKVAIPFSIAGILFSFLGTFTASLITSELLKKGFGILLLIMGIRELFSKSKDKN